MKTAQSTRTDLPRAGWLGAGRAWGAVAVAFAVLLPISACGASSTPAASERGVSSSASSAEQGTWPRTVKHDAGETSIPKKPLKVISTSLTLTGTLLAIDAPVTATAATTPSSITDEKGFFSQWAKVADDRKVQVLYPKLTLNIEDVIKADPDLIVGSTVGADSTKDQYEQLSKIAPTVMFNYGNKSWEDLAGVLGLATGHEADAKKTVSDFDNHVAEQAKLLKLPEQPVNALLFNAGQSGSVFKTDSAQGRLLTALGFTVQQVDEKYDTNNPKRDDMAAVTLENLPTALTGKSIFLVSGEEKDVSDFTSTAVLANQPAVTGKRVWALGADTFRLDYFSAKNLVERVAKAFS